MNEGRPVSGRAASAAGWLVGARFASRAIDFVSLLILARLLVPADFGLVAIAMTLIALVEAVLELPLGAVLMTLPAIERTHLDTSFTLSLLRGLTLAAVFLVCAVPFAWAYHDMRLAPVICALGLAPALRGMASPTMIRFALALDFRRDFAIEIVGKVATLTVATTTAIATHSYWAIVLGTVASPAAMMLTSYVLAPHRPRLSVAQWPVFRGYLVWSTGSQAATAVSWQCDRLILGQFVSHALLGAYSLANDLAFLPEQALIKPIVRPVGAAFALLRDDPDRLRHAYAKTATTVLAVGLPMMLGLSLLADPAVRLVLGGKWLAAVPILFWLPFTLIPALFIAPLPALIVTRGRPRMMLHLTLAEAAVRVPLMAFGAHGFGVAGVIAARAAAGTFIMLFAMRQVHTLIGAGVREQAAWVARTCAAGGALGAVLLTLRPLLAGHDGAILAGGLALCAGTAMIVYVGTLFGLWWIAGCPAGAEQAVFAPVLRRLASRRLLPDG